MATPLGLRITAIHTAGTGARSPAEEYLVLFNEGQEGVGLGGWALTLRAGQLARAVYTFPARLWLPDGTGALWQLEPGARLRLVTGAGHDRHEPATPGRSAWYHLHLGRAAFVWAPPGARVALRRPDGLAAGRPALVP